MRRLTNSGNGPFPREGWHRAGVKAIGACLLAGSLVAACSSAGGSSNGAPAPASPAAPSSPKPTLPPTTPPPPPKPITVAFTGEILLHSPVYDQAAANGRPEGLAFDFRPMFARIKPQLSAADLAICLEETPLSPTDTSLIGYPVFNSPHEIAPAIAWAGFKGCALATNHAYDQGTAGVASTIAALDAAGLAHSGTATTAAGDVPEIHVVRGVKIALLDYTYGLNGFVLPTGQNYLVNLINVPTILADAHKARLAGAQIVIVQMHWGDQYVTTPNLQQETWAREILASPDVDVIVGSHSHVVQPVEKIGSKYVLYGTGNILSNQSADCCVVGSQDGEIVTLHFVDTGGRWGVGSITYTPTYVDRFGAFIIYNDAQGYEDPTVPASLKQQLAASFQRTVAAMSAMHAPGVTPDVTPPGL